MKRVIALFLVSILLFITLCGCKKSTSTGDTTKKPQKDQISSGETEDKKDNSSEENENDWNVDDYTEYNPTVNKIVHNNEYISHESKVVSVVKKQSRRITLIEPDKAVGYFGDLKKSLSEIGAVNVMNWNTSAAKIFNTENTDLVVIPTANRIPASAVEAISNYIGKGGHILSLGGPNFSDLLYNLDGTWYTQQEFSNAFGKKPEGKKLLLDPTESKRTGITSSVGDYGLSGSSKSLKMKLSNGQTITQSVSFSANESAFGLWAKGKTVSTDKGNVEQNLMKWSTPLYISVTTITGSVWAAQATLSDDWQYYIFSANDFVKISGSDTALTLLGVESMSFGINYSPYFPQYPVIPFDMYLDKITAFEKPVEWYDKGKLPALYGFSPYYQFYDVTNGETIKTYSNQIFVTDRKYTIGKDLFSTIPGTQGTGYSKNNSAGRFIPLLEVYDSKGLRSGHLAWMFVFSAVPNQTASRDSTVDYVENCVVAGFGVNDESFYDANGIKAVQEVAAASLLNTYLLDGGTTELVYMSGDSEVMTAGVTYVNSGVDNTEAVYLVCDNNKILARDVVSAAKSKSVRTSKNGGVYYEASNSYRLRDKEPDLALAQLKIDGVVVDQIYHTIRFWKAKPESERKYVTAENGVFMRDGKQLNVFGVHYTSTNSVMRYYNWDTEYWHMPGVYDPDNVYHDLLRIKELGFNAIGCSIYDVTINNTNNPLDFLAICEDLGIYVDVAIRQSPNPLCFDKAGCDTLIKTLHFYENDTIIGYDIAYEEYLGFETMVYRPALDSLWRKWIMQQYGSISNAEKAWGCSARTDANGNVIGVSDDMLRQNEGSKYTNMVAAYRRFLDDNSAEIFSYSASYLRELDPNHLISFRMNSSACPPSDPASLMYDFIAMAGVLDIMEPEGYLFNTTSGRADTEMANYVNLYHNYATGSSAPLVWKEYGDIYQMLYYDAGALTGDLYSQYRMMTHFEEMYEMMLQTYTAGSYVWEYNGLGRYSERTDFGIVNPDGSDRPVTKVIRKYGPKLLAAKKDSGKEKVEIMTDRDKYPSAYRDMYKEAESALLNAKANNKQPVLVNEAMGKTIDEVFDIAVGTKSLTGQYPRKWVNGMFESVALKQADGSYYIIKNGETIKSAGKITLRLKVLNNQFATWPANSVNIVSANQNVFPLNLPIKTQMKHLDKNTYEVTINGTGSLELSLSYNGTLFGQRFTVNIEK